MKPRLLGAAGLAAVLLASAWSWFLARSPGGLDEAEAAVELHVRALDAHAAGDPEAAALFEQACLLRHEPSCQAVWLQLDLGTGERDEEARARLEGTARRLADQAGGTWFPLAEGAGHAVRVYCPVEREADLRGALARLRVPLGG